MSTGSAARVLRAIEVISQQGPMSPKALQFELNLSKTTAWRLVKMLSEEGWVQTRRAGQVIEIAHERQRLVAEAVASDNEFRDCFDVTANYLSERVLHGDLFVAGAETIELWESTRRAQYPQHIDTDLTALAVYGAMGSEALTAFMGAQAQAHERIKHKLSNFEGYVWGREKAVVYVSLRGARGGAACLCLSGQGAAELCDVVNDLRLRLSPFVQQYGKTGMLCTIWDRPDL